MTNRNTESADATTPARPFYFQLWFLVLVAMAVGIAVGQFHPDLGVRLQPLGDAFIKAIRVLIAPIIFCTVVHGIAGMANMARVGRVALKALIYFEVLTTVALVIGLIAVNLFKPGAGMNVDLAHVDTSGVAAYLAQTRSPACVAIESVCLDAREFAFPQTPLLVYLFNPLPEAGLRRVIGNLEDSWRKSPRPIWIVYHNPVMENVLTDSPLLVKEVAQQYHSLFRMGPQAMA